ncbi:MAG TPA: hypothetical protein VFG79_06330, partial [Solirubrobacter sp.]|nr:hypothetical protein [Solirubrobacter sp.]
MADLEIIAFRPGRRPTDEARHPWQGSSDAVAFRLGGEPDNRCYVLFAVGGASGGGYALDVTLSGPAGPLPGWDRREVAPAAFAGGEPVPRPFALGADRPYVLSIAPDTDLDVEVPFTGLALDVGIRLTRDREAVAVAHGRLEVYDVRHFGTLYERIVERVVKPDTERQRPGLSHAYHPWFPVLLIGSHKAELYTRALIGDIVHKRHNLSDPGWLVRVGLYLELLTGLGVFEAVRDDAGELLTAAERAALPDLRDRLNVDGWRRVRALRDIGPSATALLNKRRATLEFLHVHHEDLQHAIELAGPNPYHAQETWHRVFRDAERAVLRQTPAAFPELERLPPEVRRFVLWHRRGHLLLSRALRVPGLLGDQDGLFASACAPPGEPARGAHEPAVARGAAAAPRRLRLGAARGRCRAAAGLRAAARRPARAAGRHVALLAAAPGRARAARAHGSAAHLRAARADHRPGPGRRLAVRGRRGRGRGRAAARR